MSTTQRTNRITKCAPAAGLLAGLLLFLASANVLGHTGPGIIVDTDMGVDDVRALAILLNSPLLHVSAIVTSDGASGPAEGATNVCRILGFLHQETVVMGVGRELGADAPPFRRNATGLDWAGLGEPMIPVTGLMEARRLVDLVLEASPEPVIYVCLGPLSTLADVLEAAPDRAKRISKVLWFGTPPNAVAPGWNASRDPAALKKVAASGLRVETICWPKEETAPMVDDRLLDEIAALDSPTAELIVRLHSTGTGAELVRAGHFRVWDELVALRLVDESIGSLRPVADASNWWTLQAVKPEAVRRAFLAALRMVPPRATVIMAEFPTEPGRLLPDVREAAVRIIARHGVEEWKATVLTSELHRHLGTYSIVGAKMGLRARELFNVALDELHVESHAGLKPPLSCVNDGLQVATGASLGRGTIHVLEGAPPSCEAVFSYGERRLRLRLKPQFATQIAGDMAALVKKHEGLTPAYFDEVRTVSLKHWLSFDRNTIFEETQDMAEPARP